MQEFLTRNHAFIHALELNGLRHWGENRAVKRLAQQWNKLLISGGDRHGLEPNANVNLSRATTFTEFVHEIRYEDRSHVLFLPQYAQPWKHRILESTLDAIRDYPEFPLGSRTWDERVWHPDAAGVVRPIERALDHGRGARLDDDDHSRRPPDGQPARSPTVCAWPGANPVSCSWPSGKMRSS